MSFHRPPLLSRMDKDLAAGPRIGAEPGSATDPKVAAFFAIWQEIRGPRRFPRREDLGPERIARFLAGTILMKVHRDPLDFEYRIIGGDIVDRLGNLRGKRVSEGPLVNVSSSAFKNYCAVAETGVPQFLDGPATVAYSSEPYRLSRVHCPLSADDRTVDHIISFVTFQPWVR